MADIQPRPILITGGAVVSASPRPAIFWPGSSPLLSATARYPAIDALREAGAVCLHADFSTDDSILAFAEEVKAHAGSGLRAIIHNASGWMAEKPGVPLTTVLASMMQIHVNAPTCSTMPRRACCAATAMRPATLSISPTTLWSAAATNTLPTPPAKRRWII